MFEISTLTATGRFVFEKKYVFRASVRHVMNVESYNTQFGHYVKIALQYSSIPGCLGDMC